MVDLLTRGSAIISKDGRFRYRLERRWVPHGNLLSFVMLNPSTADAEIDDPTIRRCMGFARRHSFAGIVVVNLFGLRATDPRELTYADGPWGPDNDDIIASVMLEAANYQAPVVAAWGGNAIRQGAQRMIIRFRDFGVDARCLGKTKDGHPRHPLYVRADQPLEPFP